jgi:HlyD family secretion protein
MKKKKKIIILAGIALLLVALAQVFSGGKTQDYVLATVERGSVSKEIAETGQVKKGDKINLSFNNSGEVEKVYVKAGDMVQKGDLLMKLNTNSLSLQLKDAQAALALAQINLDKLLAGPTAAQIQIYQTALDNKLIALNVAKQSLASANEDALDNLASAYLKSYNAYIDVEELLEDYFTVPDQAGIAVRENKALMGNAASSILNSINSVSINSLQTDIDNALSNVKTRLSEILNALAVIRQMTESAEYRNTVSAADKTALDTHRTNINTEMTSLIADVQAINSAELAIVTAEGNWNAARYDLTLFTADPRDEDVNLCENQLIQARTNVDLINADIADSYLKSPAAGEVAEVSKRVGELAQASFQDTAVVILPDVDFQIEVNIYEEDVVNISVGNPTSIALVAFPDEEFEGEIVSIDPAESLIDGVVYYKVAINFNEVPDGVKSGMTADVVIRPEIRQDVLYIPEEAILEVDGKIIVKVLKDGEVAEREVTLGLEGEDNIEIISGLEEGEQVILD